MAARMLKSQISAAKFKSASEGDNSSLLSELESATTREADLTEKLGAAKKELLQAEQHLRDEKTVETEGMKYFNVGWLWDPQRGGHTDGSGESTTIGVQDFAHG